MEKLTSDRIFLVTYLFWMLGGCLPILPIVITGLVGSQIIWGPSYDYSPALFKENLTNFGVWLLILVAVLVISYVAFRIGLRDREVVLDGKTVLIRWGAKWPIPLKKYSASSLKDFQITKEARFAMNARSSGHYGFRNMPDRWRLKAEADGKTVNLGSYATEAEARRAVSSIQNA